ncbi:hypothetical protein Pdw03_1275 [Penicillium digitatum]|uniref:Uncharacterized protein n=1 Tax=Penicillium digitatum TaxID=36651 RepID=A0A7T6XSD4_PENDI|nr:hypothetical protein Pdw03_1275 [Penicillium digitatum]
MGFTPGAHVVNWGENDIEICVARDVASRAVIAVECVDHRRVVSFYEFTGAVVASQTLTRVVDVLIGHGTLFTRHVIDQTMFDVYRVECADGRSVQQRSLHL